jgi:hypothetical protein
MGYITLSNAISVGKTLRCKYPKHGNKNVLKWHEGVIEKASFGPHGAYALVRSATNQYRTLRCDKMIDASVS